VLSSPLKRSVLSLSVAAAILAPALATDLSPATAAVAERVRCGWYPNVAVRRDCWVMENQPKGVTWRKTRVARCIRHYESGHDYTAVSPRGSFRGAYQFKHSTFESLGPDRFDGILANKAPALLQDLKARRLYRRQGLAPWPTPHRRCG
jgi:hypothetical protein